MKTKIVKDVTIAGIANPGILGAVCQRCGKEFKDYHFMQYLERDIIAHQAMHEVLDVLEEKGVIKREETKLADLPDKEPAKIRGVYRNARRGEPVLEELGIDTIG